MAVFYPIALPTATINAPYYRYSIGSAGFREDRGVVFGNIKNRSSAYDLAPYCGEIRSILGTATANKRTIIKLSSLNFTGLPSAIEGFYSNNYYLNLGSIPNLNSQNTYQSLNLNISNNVGLSNTTTRTASNVELTIKHICNNLLISQGFNNIYQSGVSQSFYNKVLQIRIIATSTSGSGIPAGTELFNFYTGVFDSSVTTKPWSDKKLLLTHTITQNQPSSWAKDSKWFTNYTIEFYGITDPNTYSGLDVGNAVLQIAPNGISESKLITYILAGNTAKLGIKFLPVGLSTTFQVQSIIIPSAKVNASVGYRIRADGTIFVGMSLQGDSNFNGSYELSDNVSGNNAIPIPSTSPRNNWIKGDFNFDNNYDAKDRALATKLTNNFKPLQRYINTLNLPGIKAIPFSDQYFMYANGNGQRLSTNTDSNISSGQNVVATGYIYKNWGLLRCSIPFLYGSTHYS